MHVSYLQQHPCFQITDVVDLDPERRQEAEEKLGCRSHATRDDLLSHGKADMVVIATPTLTHEADALAILSAGKHCIAEKPVAMTYEGVLRVVEEARSAGKHLFAHHQHLFTPEHNFLKNLLARGQLGDLIEIRYSWGKYARRADWQTLRKNGGGLWANYGSHALSTMLDLLGGRVVRLSGTALHVKDAGDADDHAHFLLETDNHRIGDIFVSSCSAVSQPRYVVLGSAGAAVALDKGKALVRYYNKKDVPALEAFDGAAPGRKYGTGETLPWQEETVSYDLEEGSDFYDNVAAVLENRAGMIVTPGSALEVARVLEWGRTGVDPVANLSP